jgi:hypothetical protein
VDDPLSELLEKRKQEGLARLAKAENSESMMNWALDPEVQASGIVPNMAMIIGVCLELIVANRDLKRRVEELELPQRRVLT